MKNLIGWNCAIYFNLPASEWPIAGSPAWAVVTDVDMPMVELTVGSQSLWVNAATIQMIRPVKRTPFWTL